MEKKTYIQPAIKILSALYLLDQTFPIVSGQGGNAGGAAAKRQNGFDETDEESDNIWNFKW